MNLKRAKKFPISENLQWINHYLSKKNISHRIIEENEHQVLCVPENLSDTELNHIIEQARLFKTAGNHTKDATPFEFKKNETHTTDSSSFFAQALRAPVTTISVIFGILGALLTAYTQFYQVLTFLPFSIALENGQPWRLLTPTFLHFTFLHIVFNALWIWEFGKRLEQFLGTFFYIGSFLAIAIGANYLQFLLNQTGIFGGLSGVVYGYLGMLFILSRFFPENILKIPTGIYIFMVIWLLLGILKIVDAFIAGSVANGAHLGGLIMGLIIGLIMSTVIQKTKPI